MIKNKIVVLRAEKGWSQQELASRVNVTRQSIAAIEKGRYSLSLQLAYDISVAFGKKIDEVFIFDYDNKDMDVGDDK